MKQGDSSTNVELPRTPLRNLSELLDDLDSKLMTVNSDRATSAEFETANKAAKSIRAEIERRFARSEKSPPTEGYPGIAHDFETMRTALVNLVRLKDLKGWIEAGTATDAAKAQYEREKEPAWEAARLALENAAPQAGTTAAPHGRATASQDPVRDTEPADAACSTDKRGSDRFDVLAQRFHEVYEQLAPLYRWETQERSRVPWAELPAEQRGLMRETVKRVLDEDALTVPASATRAQIIEECAKHIERAPITYAGPDPQGVRVLRYLIVVAIRALADRGSTHSTKEKTMVNIKVNGDTRQHIGLAISYADVVTHAGHDPQRTLSVVYSTSRSGDEQRRGSLLPGAEVLVEEGMRFTVADTSNA